MKYIGNDILQNDGENYYFESKLGDGDKYEWINFANQYESFYESETSINVLNLLVETFKHKTKKWLYLEQHEIIPSENFERPYISSIITLLKNKKEIHKFNITDIDLSTSHHVDYKRTGIYGEYYQSIPLMIGETNGILSKMSYDYIKSKRNGFDKRFMCLMAGVRPERIKVNEFLKSKEYENDIYKSYAIHDKSNKESVKLPKNIDFPFNLRNDGNDWNYNVRNGISNVYIKSFCNIICESKWDNRHIQITEKTDKAFTTLQPFIIVGNYQSLKALRKLGFKTFSDFWNEDYDEIKDEHERLNAIFETIEFIQKTYPYEKLEEVYGSMEDILKHNFLLSQKMWESTHKNYYTQPAYDKIIINKKTHEISLQRFG